MDKERTEQNSMEFLNEDFLENQELISVFHREDMEYRVKAELNEILEDIESEEVSATDLSKIFDRIWQKIEPKHKKRINILYPFYTFVRIAAILITGVLIGVLIHSTTISRKSYFYTTMSPKGSVSQLILPDSTFICLNAGSTIKYNVSPGNRREVYLSGEAWFQVKKHGKMPFLVHTSSYDVKVEGTEFDVKAYDEDNDVTTTLEKGSVVIINESDQFFNPVNLKPGEQVIYSRESKTLAVEHVNTKMFTSWKENKLIFVNMSFGDLVVLLERKYGVEIRVADPGILKYHYDGTIKNETIIQILNILKLTLPINYTINNQTIEIMNK